MHNDGSGGRTALYLDDVSLLACEPDATPFVTPSATAAAPLPSATPQPVATPAPGGCVVSDTLTNGGFENTLDSQLNWSMGESPVPPVLSNQPSAGAWSLRLGNPPGSGTQNILSYSSVRQFIQLPANASSASLSWSHLSRSQDPATISPSLASDRQDLILLTSSLATEAILYRSRAESATWETVTVDLTPYLGGSYNLYFNVFNDGNGKRTWMFLDDVQLHVCFANAAAPSAGGAQPMPSSRPLPQHLRSRTRARSRSPDPAHRRRWQTPPQKRMQARRRLCAARLSRSACQLLPPSSRSPAHLPPRRRSRTSPCGSDSSASPKLPRGRPSSSFS